MDETFFVVGSDADGTTFDGPISRAELENRLAENHYGAIKRFAYKNPGTDGFCIQLREDELLIIRGATSPSAGPAVA